MLPSRRRSTGDHDSRVHIQFRAYALILASALNALSCAPPARAADAGMVRSPPAIPDQGTPHATSHASRQWPIGGDDAEKDGAADGTSAYVPQQDTYDLFDMPAPPSLQQRSGNRYEDGEAISTWPAPSAAWVRTAKPIDNPVRPGSDGRQNMTPANLNAGLDGVFFDSDAGILIGSFSTRYQPGDARLFPPHGISKIYPDDYRFAGTLTWFGTVGFYLEAQAELSWTVNDVATEEATTGGSVAGQAFSLEIGQSLDLGNGLSIKPQAQLIYTTSEIAGLDIGQPGNRYAFDGDNVRARTGIALSKKNVWLNQNGEPRSANLYAIANLYYAFDDTTGGNVRDTFDFSLDEQSWGGEIGIGATYGWRSRGTRYSVFAEITSYSGFHRDALFYGGLKVRW